MLENLHANQHGVSASWCQQRRLAPARALAAARAMAEHSSPSPRLASPVRHSDSQRPSSIEVPSVRLKSMMPGWAVPQAAMMNVKIENAEEEAIGASGQLAPADPGTADEQPDFGEAVPGVSAEDVARYDAETSPSSRATPPGDRPTADILEAIKNGTFNYNCSIGEQARWIRAVCKLERQNSPLRPASRKWRSNALSPGSARSPTDADVLRALREVDEELAAEGAEHGEAEAIGASGQLAPADPYSDPYSAEGAEHAEAEGAQPEMEDAYAEPGETEDAEPCAGGDEDGSKRKKKKKKLRKKRARACGEDERGGVVLREAKKMRARARGEEVDADVADGEPAAGIRAFLDANLHIGDDANGEPAAAGIGAELDAEAGGGEDADGEPAAGIGAEPDAEAGGGEDADGEAAAGIGALKHSENAEIAPKRKNKRKLEAEADGGEDAEIAPKRKKKRKKKKMRPSTASDGAVTVASKEEQDEDEADAAGASGQLAPVVAPEAATDANWKRRYQSQAQVGGRYGRTRNDRCAAQMRFKRSITNLKNGKSCGIPEDLQVAALNDAKSLFGQYFAAGCDWRIVSHQRNSVSRTDQSDQDRNWVFKFQFMKEFKEAPETGQLLWASLCRQPGMHRFHPDMVEVGQDPPKEAKQVHYLKKDASKRINTATSSLDATATQSGIVPRLGDNLVITDPKGMPAIEDRKEEDEAAGVSKAAGASGQLAPAAAGRAGAKGQKEEKGKKLTKEELKAFLEDEQKKEQEKLRKAADPLERGKTLLRKIPQMLSDLAEAKHDLSLPPIKQCIPKRFHSEYVHAVGEHSSKLSDLRAQLETANKKDQKMFMKQVGEGPLDQGEQELDQAGMTLKQYKNSLHVYGGTQHSTSAKVAAASAKAKGKAKAKSAEPSQPSDEAQPRKKKKAKQ